MSVGSSPTTPLVSPLAAHRRRILKLVSILALLSLCAIAIFSFREKPKKLDSALLESDNEFDPLKLYSKAKDTDWDHPNRIDDYGCLFSACDSDESETILTRVRRLKIQLRKFAKLQARFEEKLDKPVQTTVSVEPGSPGLMGRRGPRGSVGPQGYRGDTGPMGRAGHVGRPGRPGNEGVTGPPGIKGPQGDSGPAGPPGIRGPVGARGPQGPDGPDGKPGPKGFPGDNGVAGQPGQRGNVGPKGISPQGPAGPNGIAGSKGPTGARGTTGNRGPSGPPGAPGDRGPPGIAGFRGAPGIDAKQSPPGGCGGQDMSGRSLCCGQAEVNWQAVANDNRAVLEVSTASCKFTDDTVMYFTSLSGGIAMDVTGSRIIQSSTKSGFKVQIDTPFAYSRQVSYRANQNGLTLQWCGAGPSTGDKVSAVCCGNDPATGWQRNWFRATKEVDTGLCKLRGSPVYLSAVAAPGGAEVEKVLGAAGVFPGSGRPFQSFRMYLEDRALAPACSGGAPYADSCRLNGVRNAVVDSGDYAAQFCALGLAFPSGDALMQLDAITKDQFPCQGVRLVENGIVATNDGKACCQISDDEWTPRTGYISKTIDTSVCGFVEYPTPVYVTSLLASTVGSGLMGISGISSHVDSSASGFTVRLSGPEALSAQQSPGKVQWCGFGMRKGQGKAFGAQVGYWTVSMYSSTNELVYLPNVADLTRVGVSKAREINFRSVGDFQNAVSGTPGQLFVWVIDGKILIRGAGDYSMCITSDDGSYLYVDGNLLVSNGGLHGDVKKCATINLAEGGHTVQVRGFNNYGGASQYLTYSGPDTKQKEVNMPSSITTGASAPEHKSGFSLSLFSAPYWLGSQPDLGSRDLTFLGQLVVPDINIKTVEELSALFPKAPTTNVAWAAYGKATIVIAGTYSFCITSDDGSFLFVDGPMLVNNDGLHGMVRRCGNKEMSAGDHTIYAKGFQAGGGMGLVVEYNGPDTGGQTVLLKSGIACTETTLGCRKTMSFIKHPDGRTWKNDNNAIRLDRGTEMKLAYYDGGDVYAHDQGRVALLQDDNMKLSVRHTGYWMYTHQFAANNFDFAWRLAESAGGIFMYNDYSGGWWAGYDQGKDQLILVASNDARIIKWNFNPLPTMYLAKWPVISHPDGRTWKNNGNAICLNSGATMRVEIYPGTDVFGAQNGMVGLFQNGNRGLAVRHAGYVMWTHGFTPNNYDFGWKLVAFEGGIRLYNGFGGGHWVGYDKGQDRVLIVSSGDGRIITWKFDPMPATKYIH